jgi:hypothetical protein
MVFQLVVNEKKNSAGRLILESEAVLTQGRELAFVQSCTLQLLNADGVQGTHESENIQNNRL